MGHYYSEMHPETTRCPHCGKGVYTDSCIAAWAKTMFPLNPCRCPEGAEARAEMNRKYGRKEDQEDDSRRSKRTH